MMRERHRYLISTLTRGVMMTIFTTQALSAIAVIVAASALGACQKPAGPAERAGQAIDKSTAKVGQEIERAGERIQDAAKGK